MKNRTTIRAKVLLIAFIINALCTVSYSIYSYYSHKAAFLKRIDSKLITAAYALEFILPEGYHDRIENATSVSAVEYDEIKRLVTSYAKSIEITWLYSYMELDGELKTTSTNVLPSVLEGVSIGECSRRLRDRTEERGNFFCALFHASRDSGGDIDVCDAKNYAFFRPEEFSKGIREALDTMTPRFDSSPSEWGNFRSLYIPMKNKAGRRYVVAADVRSDYIQTYLCNTLLHCVGIGVSIFAVVWLLSYMLVNRIMEPVSRLTSYTRGLAEGGFHLGEEQQRELQELAHQYKDEVGELASGFSDMAAKLLEYIADLKETTAAKERIESELSIAHNIQMSFLPKIFPPFPEREEFALFGTLVPAKEVGGDLFDFCMLDDDRLFYYVGDVSDKGVPAALFMAVTMTLMKRTANQKGIDPAEILRLVNIDLCDGNENVLFVTLVCAIINIKSGEILYSNAGHNPPLILRANGTVERLTLPEGLVLGIMPEAAYSTMDITLGVGDSILMYTDGVTEAMNTERKMFSEKKLFAMASDLTDKGVEEQCGLVMEAVKAHAGEAPASDDITILSLKYLGTR